MSARLQPPSRFVHERDVKMDRSDLMGRPQQLESESNRGEGWYPHHPSLDSRPLPYGAVETSQPFSPPSDEGRYPHYEVMYAEGGQAFPSAAPALHPAFASGAQVAYGHSSNGHPGGPAAASHFAYQSSNGAQPLYGMYAQPYPAPPSHMYDLQQYPPAATLPQAPSAAATTSVPEFEAGDVDALAPLQQAPTYHGHVKSAKDAILLLSACDLPPTAGSDPSCPPPRCVMRRLLDSERAALVRSGSIFAWDEKKAGMRRWTDGKCWSASRVSGCFLTYRELEVRKRPAMSSASGTTVATSNQYKLDGLIKQSFTITTRSGRKLHVISYYTKRDVREGRLRRISEDPRFVGASGGEWGLNVDEAEYTDPTLRDGAGEEVIAAAAATSSPRDSINGLPRRNSSAIDRPQHQRFPSGQGSGNFFPGIEPESPPTTGTNNSSFGVHQPLSPPNVNAASPRGLMDGPLRTSGEAPSSTSSAVRSGLLGGASGRGRYAPQLPPPTSVMRPLKRNAPSSPSSDRYGGANGVLVSSSDRPSSSDVSMDLPPPQRPRLSRMRSSSMSGLTPNSFDADDARRGDSYQSSSSLGTTVSASSNSRALSEERNKLAHTDHDSAVGALLSLRSSQSSRSADRSPPVGSQTTSTFAVPVRPTVHPLQQLKTLPGRRSAAVGRPVHSITSTSVPSSPVVGTSLIGSAASVQVPERSTSDRFALNKLTVRL